MADATYTPKVYMTDGGDKQVVASGGAIDVESGGALKLAGTAVNATAAEINTLDISAVGGATKILKVPIVRAAATTEQKSGVELPAKAVVLNVYVDVITAESTGATKTIDVGTDGSGSNDPDGWLNGVSVAATGIVKGTLVNTGQTLGALLSVDEDGSGALVPEVDVTSGGEEITYTFGSNDFAELVANIIIHYVEVA